MSGWTAAELYGTTPLMGPTSSSAPMGHRIDDLDTGTWATLVNPRNPLVIFGALLAITVGAAGFAGSGRVGPVKVSVGAGKA